MKLIKALLTNRFGIVLATVNVCCLFILCTALPASMDQRLDGKLFSALNLPAMIPTAVLADMIMSNTSLQTSSVEAVLLPAFAFLIMVQWLMIAQVASVAAQVLKEFMRGER